MSLIVGWPATSSRTFPEVSYCITEETKFWLDWQFAQCLRKSQAGAQSQGFWLRVLTCHPPAPQLPPATAWSYHPIPLTHLILPYPLHPSTHHPTMIRNYPGQTWANSRGWAGLAFYSLYISWFDKHSVSGTPPLCQSSNKASPCLPEAPGIRHIHVAHQYPRLDCELPRGRAVLSICVPRAWGRDWHTVGISNVFLLLLLLSHFSRVRLCATP